MEPMTTIALRAARKAGDLIVRASDELDRVGYHAKGAADFVSEIDIAAERELLYHLQKAYPDHGFLCEESGRTGAENAEYIWVIDPLDGTSNFLRGIPHYCVSLGCLKNGKLEHAVIVDPVRREEFIASRGRGAQVNGKRIRVSARTDLRESLLGTGVPFLGHQEERAEAYGKSLIALSTRSMGVRRMGAAALDLAYVAAGRLDAFWELGLKPWDMAAGVLLVREAGGLVTDFSGGETFMDSGDIACGNAKILKGLLPTLRPLAG